MSSVLGLWTLSLGRGPTVSWTGRRGREAHRLRFAAQADQGPGGPEHNSKAPRVASRQNATPRLGVNKSGRRIRVAAFSQEMVRGLKQELSEAERSPLPTMKKHGYPWRQKLRRRVRR